MSSPVGPAGCYSSNPHIWVDPPNFYDVKTLITEVFDIIVSDQIWLRCHTKACFYYEKSDILSVYYFLFQYSKTHEDFPKVDVDEDGALKSWPQFLLLYCCHKKNVFIWLN